jgi:sugar O-acyltransferase (sialic acid O-acetyltransferase NeuD family)
MKTVGIFGTSGFAREVGDIVEALGMRPLYVARDNTELAQYERSAELILESDLASQSHVTFAIGVGDNAARQRIAARFAGIVTFANLIHPDASLGHGQRAAIDSGTGNIICAGVRLTNNIVFGSFCIVNINATIGHDSIIHDFANISPGANVSGNVSIGLRALIGTGAAINQGSSARKLTIGDDTIVGSGAVVVKDCEPASVYAGVPARKIK